MNSIFLPGQGLITGVNGISLLTNIYIYRVTIKNDIMSGLNVAVTPIGALVSF